MHLEELVARYGLAAVLLGSAVEGDLTLILAGVMAHLGFFPFPLAMAAGVTGSFIGDLAWYAVGRARGPRFRAGGFYQRIGPRIERLASRLGPAELIASRFVYGTKAASIVFWGLHGMPTLRFVLVDIVGCLLGAFVFTGLGYLVSGSAMILLGRVRRVQFWLLGAAVIGVLLVVLVNWTAKKELHIEDGEQEGEEVG